MPPAEGRFVVVPEIMRFAILRFVLLETPAVLGLVLAIIRRDPLMFFLLGLASLAALFLAFPSGDRIRRIDATLNEPR